MVVLSRSVTTGVGCGVGVAVGVAVGTAVAVGVVVGVSGADTCCPCSCGTEAEPPCSGEPLPAGGLSARASREGGVST
ncbi:MAG: hypothetical protein F4X14_08715 [Caldilineaceae bacterium SB0661_bin_32]|uniref:Uncharacterized protein n=1 Tax=Caldilineaceae bacterium SB0661_bin_32 TaxID=2605255 RepID=A0A6B1D6H1_9CHLR|nr:hypothetical protein [Caldilineaceae bacterium SB0661_bin_32]